MLEIIAIIAVVLAIAIAVVLILAMTKPDTFSVQRATDDQGAAGENLSADQRFPSLGIVVALGEQGPGDAAQL